MSLDLIAASATFPGLATTGTQTFAGAKTWSTNSAGSVTYLFINPGAGAVDLRLDGGAGAVYRWLKAGAEKVAMRTDISADALYIQVANGAKDAAICDQNANWIIGAITSTATHIIKSASDPLNLVTSSANNHLGFLYNTSTVGGYIRSNATASFFFLNGSASELGRVTSTGWTLGASATDSVFHLFQGTGGATARGNLTANYDFNITNSRSAGEGLGTSGSRLLVSANDGNQVAVISCITGSNIRFGSFSNLAVDFVRNGTTKTGGYANDSAWTLGAVGYAGSHNINGTLVVNAASAYVTGQAQIVGNPTATSVTNGSFTEFGLGTNGGGIVILEDSSGQEPMAIYFFNRAGTTTLIASNAGFTSNWTVSNPTNGFIRLTNASGGTLSIKGFAIGITP